MTMFWAQVFPFAALQLYEGDRKGQLTTFLVGTFASWLLLNAIFFCTIDLAFVKTFFTRTTAPQYTCELFETSVVDAAKFRAAFKNRLSYTESVHEEAKEWVENNIARWQREKQRAGQGGEGAASALGRSWESKDSYSSQ